MTSPRCPTQEILALLREGHESSSDSEPELLEHLTHCPECQALLESQAAAEQSWTDVRHALTVAHEASVRPNSIALSAATENAATGSQRAPKTSHQALSAETNELSSESASSPNSPQNPAWQFLLHSLAPTDDPAAAGRIGTFEVLGIIGSGGMGLVLKAREPSLDRFVAIKVLAPHLASSQSARKRFAREARAAAAVIHDNVIQIYQVAEWQDLPYLVMPYLPDPSLAERIDQDGPLSIEATLSIGMQVARGLSAAHTQGLVHRDVKPANVLLSKGTERAVITDFGLARTADDATLTRAGTLAGTPHYMSPEQARGEQFDARSDLFSLGSLLYAMLTGEPPVNEELGSRTIERLAQNDFPELPTEERYPHWLVRLVNWLRAQEPEERPQSAAHTADLMERALAHLRQPSKSVLPSELDRSPTTRRLSNRQLTIASGLIIALLLAIVFGMQALAPSVTHSPENDISRKNSTPDDATRGLPPTSEIKYPDPVLLNWDYTESQLESIDMALDELEGSVHR